MRSGLAATLVDRTRRDPAGLPEYDRWRPVSGVPLGGVPPLPPFPLNHPTVPTRCCYDEAAQGASGEHRVDDAHNRAICALTSAFQLCQSAHAHLNHIPSSRQ